jgi:putative ABC transport system ATP-binding protein
MSSPIIHAEHIGVIYNKGKENETHSLRRINLKIHPREYVVIFGPSGCGKSTLLYSLSGLQTPSYGTVKVKGKNLENMSPRERSRLRLFQVGMIFQAFHLIPTLSVLDNVCLSRIFEGEDRKRQREAGMQLLQRFSISEQANKYPSALSGGQQQRVAISRSLINNPDIILADEPVGNLDSESAENVMRILRELNEVDQKTIILVTHDPRHLVYADRILEMKDGEIIKEIINTKNNQKEDVSPIIIKRKQTVDDDVAAMLKEMKDTPIELRMLMRTFKGLSEAQGNVLLVPFKAKQLLWHSIHDFTEEQLDASSRYFKEFLFGNISGRELKKKLDLAYEKGGAGLHKNRAETIAFRVERIMHCVNLLSKGKENALDETARFLDEFFNLGLNERTNSALFFRFKSILALRTSCKADKRQLFHWLDISYDEGGMGLRKDVAEKITREMEMIMLLKYS